MSAQLMTMMAGIAPEETVIELIEETLQEYKTNNTQEIKNKLSAACTLFIIKNGIQQRFEGDVEKAMEDVGKKERLIDLFKEIPETVSTKS